MSKISTKWKVIAFLVGLVISIGSMVHFTAGYVYSTGYRDGFIQKISNKGYFLKTWEGELAMQGFSQGGLKASSSGNVWMFSIIDTKIVEELTAINASQFVRIHYNEVLFPYPWEAATNNIVTKFEMLGDGGLINNPKTAN